MIVTFCRHKTVSDTDKVEQQLLDILCGILTEAKNSGEKVSFYCGGYGSFDGLASKSIDKARATIPETPCEKVFITPYITESYSERNKQMKEYYDDVVYPPIENAPYRLAILKRNKWMVDQADIVIAYVHHSWGGAAQTLKYAERKKKKIIRVPQ